MLLCAEIVKIFYKACPGRLEANATHIQWRTGQHKTGLDSIRTTLDSIKRGQLLRICKQWYRESPWEIPKGA